MIVNHKTLWGMAPIKDMHTTKRREHGVTSGLGEAGYDIRIKQKIEFSYHGEHRILMVDDVAQDDGRFAIASAIEEFDMPNNLVGIVHDKSTWARKGLSVFNTVIEPGWKGFLTLELVYHGWDDLLIPAGAGIAQVVFHMTTDAVQYEGKYQNQADQPVSAIHEPATTLLRPNGRGCTICKLPQFDSPSGPVCELGHGGDPGEL